MVASSRPTIRATIIHADHGAQFTTWAFTRNIRNYGLKPSLGTVGDSYDNAMIKSFWGRMQTEFLNRKTWITVVELSRALVDYIENLHSTSRRHTSRDMFRPIEYETIKSSQPQLSCAQSTNGGHIKMDLLHGVRTSLNVAPMVRQMYAAVIPELHIAAARSVLAHLTQLVQDGRLLVRGGGLARLSSIYDLP